MRDDAATSGGARPDAEWAAGLPFRAPELSRRLVRGVKARLKRPVRLMEVCGTHTMAISRSGIRGALPAGLELRSGPGCPVCVTDQSDIDLMIGLGRVPGVIVTTFGDMMRVPGSATTLERERAAGADVRVVYSPLDAVDIAAALPGREVTFLGVGFETTAPVAALAVLEAERRGIPNFSLYSAHKLVPPALRALLDGPAPGIDGFLLPGHVSTVLGRRGFQFLADEYRAPAAITGFEPADILYGIQMVLEMLESGQPAVKNAYPRAVREDGNPEARRAMDGVFEPAAVPWRGLGEIPSSGLALRAAYAGRDAARRFGLERRPAAAPRGCRCGEVLRGRTVPAECPLFGTACTPAAPVGPCMVSSEGTCAAYYQYGGK